MDFLQNRQQWSQNEEEKMSLELKQNINELYAKLEHLKDYL
jgi:hypothetical protein